nr:GNAT family N-acetyltransferase [Bacteroidota bacterium]
MLYNINNTIIIDLECDEETLLNNISKYQRRHIKRGAKKGISVKAFNRDYNYAQLEELFHQYQHVHYQAAGRITRSQGTWDAMYEAAVSGKGSLFVSYMGNTPISYLYCGEFSCMAFGFSQANVELYEKEFSPRHLLEWEAIRYYKKKGFKYYEIGERFYGPGLFKIPSDKEISISVMKERYGGFFLPKITWIGYHDEAFMKDDLMDRMGELIRKRWQT